jgi:hypothetical protein
MSVFDYLRNSEQSIYDFNTPWSMAIVVLGFLSAWLVTNILEHLGITRHVWHLPLFFAALKAGDLLFEIDPADYKTFPSTFLVLPGLELIPAGLQIVGDDIPARFYPGPKKRSPLSLRNVSQTSVPFRNQKRAPLKDRR